MLNIISILFKNQDFNFKKHLSFYTNWKYSITLILFRKGTEKYFDNSKITLSTVGAVVIITTTIMLLVASKRTRKYFVNDTCVYAGEGVVYTAFFFKVLF